VVGAPFWTYRRPVPGFMASRAQAEPLGAAVSGSKLAPAFREQTTATVVGRSSSTFELKNRVALMTGASRAIGKAISLALAEAGATVAVNYRERSGDAGGVAEAIRKSGGRAGSFGADVSLSTAVHSMIHDVEERLGPIDILVNNAGMAAARRLEDITEQDFDRAIAVNLKSAFLRTQAVLPGTWALGRIVNVSSMARARVSRRC